MNRCFYQTKSCWAMAVGILGAAATCYSFALDAHPMVKASLTFATVSCGFLAAYFTADRVTTEARQTRDAVADNVPDPVKGSVKP